MVYKLWIGLCVSYLRLQIELMNQVQKLSRQTHFCTSRTNSSLCELELSSYKKESIQVYKKWVIESIIFFDKFELSRAEPKKTHKPTRLVSTLSSTRPDISSHVIPQWVILTIPYLYDFLQSIVMSEFLLLLICRIQI